MDDSSDEQVTKSTSKTQSKKDIKGSKVSSTKSTPKDTPVGTPKGSRKGSPQTSSTSDNKKKKKEKEASSDEEESEPEVKPKGKSKEKTLKSSSQDKSHPSFYYTPDYVDISTDLSHSLPPVRKTLPDEVLSQIREFRSHSDAQKYLKSHHHDFFVSRWLTARKGDVEKAVALFVESMKWREENDVDNILETLPKWEHFDKLVKYWPGSLMSMSSSSLHTKDGSPVMIEALGRVDPNTLMSYGIENVLKFHIYGMEKVQKMYWEYTEKYGYFPGLVVIQDLSGVGLGTLSQTMTKVFQKAIQINQNNYPDQLRKMYIINTPQVVNMMWNVASLWFDPRTLAKFEFCKGNENAYNAIFTKIIPESELPKRLGGNLDADIPAAGVAPVTSGTPKRQAEVPRAGKHNIVVEVTKNDHVEWEFTSKSYDISWGLSFTSAKNKETISVVEVTRVDSHKEAVTGNHKATSDGTLEFLFDNSYSWTRGKTIEYSILKNAEPIE